MRRIAVLITLIVLPLTLTTATATAAKQQGVVTIETQKPFGPAPGTFSAAGSVSDSGAFVNISFTFSATRAPNFVIVHVTQRFEGSLGTFTLRADIAETVTEDPNVLTDKGTWAILDGTGAYKTLRAQGQLTGTADHNTGVISRTFTGTVHSA